MRTRRDTSEVIVPTLRQRQLIARRLRIAKKPWDFQIRGEAELGAERGWGSKAPGGEASSPARKERQASKSARGRSAKGVDRRIRAKVVSASYSPAQARPTSCWLSTSSGLWR